jgi:hypothetical protein
VPDAFSLIETEKVFERIKLFLRVSENVKFSVQPFPIPFFRTMKFPLRIPLTQKLLEKTKKIWYYDFPILAGGLMVPS